MNNLDRAVALQNFLESDFCQTSKEVRIQAIRGELVHVSDRETKKRQKMETLFRTSLDVMCSLHSSAVPDEEDELALIPADEFRRFVDAHATLCYELAHLEPNTVLDKSDPSKE